jgi:hypothetical protein
MKKPMPIAHITVRTSKDKHEPNDARHYCADCSKAFNCKNPDGRVLARVLNNCDLFIDNR